MQGNVSIDPKRPSAAALSTESSRRCNGVRQWVLIDLPKKKARPPGVRLLIAVYLLAQAQTVSVVRLYPVDDTTRDPAFRSFVKRLRSAVEARNANALRKLVDEGVVVGPADDDTGWPKFAAMWRPDSHDSKVWSALSDLLSFGFVREHPSLFVSPYLVWRFPRELNMATHLVVIRDKAALRVAPSVRAPVAASLSFDIVQRLGQPETSEDLVRWVRVRTADGKTGYLNERDVVSPLMPRAQFGIRRGRWILIALEGQNR